MWTSQTCKEPCPVKEYDLLLPLEFNDGSSIPSAIFLRVQAELLERFEGVTYCPQAREGLWRMGDVVYKDRVVIFRIVTGKPRAARRFLVRLKKRLLKELQQEDIFIVERDVRVL